MKLWIDTEFNAFGGYFISVGIVDIEDNRFYEVSDEWTHQPRHPWVEENVIGKLGKSGIPLVDLKTKLEAWLKRYPKLEFVADHPADVVHLMHLIEKGHEGDWMFLPPTTIEMATGLGATAKTSAIPHNALADAVALRDAYLKAGRV